MIILGWITALAVLLVTAVNIGDPGRGMTPEIERATGHAGIVSFITGAAFIGSLWLIVEGLL